MATPVAGYRCSRLGPGACLGLGVFSYSATLLDDGSRLLAVLLGWRWAGWLLSVNSLVTSLWLLFFWFLDDSEIRGMEEDMILNRVVIFRSGDAKHHKRAAQHMAHFSPDRPGVL